MRLTNGDMAKTVTVEATVEAVELAANKAYTLVQALLEHWTDNEGLHEGQFLKELAAELPKALSDGVIGDFNKKGLI